MPDKVCGCACGKKQQQKKLTINSDLAVAINVTGLEELLGLSVGQSSGRGGEGLQEQPEEDGQRKREILSGERFKF